MRSFLIMFSCYVCAGVYGTIVANTIASRTLQQHSGTQSYVRVVR